MSPHEVEGKMKQPLLPADKPRLIQNNLPADAALEALKQKNRGPKKRFLEHQDKRTRKLRRVAAAQGHSGKAAVMINKDKLQRRLTPVEVPEILIHGTKKHLLPSIYEVGLRTGGEGGSDARAG